MWRVPTRPGTNPSWSLLMTCCIAGVISLASTEAWTLLEESVTEMHLVSATKPPCFLGIKNRRASL